MDNMNRVLHTASIHRIIVNAGGEHEDERGVLFLSCTFQLLCCYVAMVSDDDLTHLCTFAFPPRYRSPRYQARKPDVVRRDADSDGD